MNRRFSAAVLLIFLTTMNRLLPHPPHFASIGGMPLFGASYFTQRYWVSAVPAATVQNSGMILNHAVYEQYVDRFKWFHTGFTAEKTRILNLIASILGASAVFFTVSNFGVYGFPQLQLQPDTEQ